MSANPLAADNAVGQQSPVEGDRGREPLVRVAHDGGHPLQGRRRAAPEPLGLPCLDVEKVDKGLVALRRSSRASEKQLAPLESPLALHDGQDIRSQRRSPRHGRTGVAVDILIVPAPNRGPQHCRCAWLKAAGCDYRSEEYDGVVDAWPPREAVREGGKAQRTGWGLREWGKGEQGGFEADGGGKEGTDEGGWKARSD